MKPQMVSRYKILKIYRIPVGSIYKILRFRFLKFSDMHSGMIHENADGYGTHTPTANIYGLIVAATIILNCMLNLILKVFSEATIILNCMLNLIL
jgi:hypothetical protein